MGALTGGSASRANASKRAEWEEEGLVAQAANMPKKRNGQTGFIQKNIRLLLFRGQKLRKNASTPFVHTFHLAPGVVLLALLACQSGFDKAQRADNIAAYQEYLRSNQEEESVLLAQERLAELEFKQAKELHSILGYKRFLEKFPNAPEAKPAAVLLENLRFESAITEGTPHALRRFLKEYPEGPHRAEAMERLAQTEQTELEHSDDLTRLGDAAQFYADKPLGALANDRLDEVRFQNAKTAGDYFEYLSQFPAGKYRDDARVALLSLEWDSLLAFSQWQEAERLSKQPLANRMADVEMRLKKFRQLKALLENKSPEFLKTQMGFSLHSPEELEAALKAADILLRAEAVQELGFRMEASVVDDLLGIVGASRNVLVRQRAFESLQRLFQALPGALANYQVAKREQQQAVKELEGSEALKWAILYDLSGQHAKAALLYSKAYAPELPDPILLRRWITLRKEQKRYYSSAVAARQLAWWAERTVDDIGPIRDTEVLFAARELCAALDMAEFAVAALEVLAKENTDFPEDIPVFLQKAQGNLRLVQARLQDVELALLEQEPQARRCESRGLSWSMEAKVQERKKAFEKLAKQKPAAAKLLIQRVMETDPLVELRAELQSLQATLNQKTDVSKTR